MKTQIYKKELSYQGQKIAYTLKVREQRNIILKLQDNEIVVSAPTFAQDWEIERIIYRNIKKIEKFLTFVKQHRTVVLYGPNKYIKIWGQEVPFYYENEVINTDLKNEVFIFKQYDDEKETLLKIYNKLKKHYEKDFAERLQYWANLMKAEFKNLTVKWFKGKWGICYPTQSKILLNIRLIHYDKSALDYVCVHELAHLFHANHSRDFWHLIERYLPDYKKRADILRIKIT